jgi:hypothetical protein
MVLIVSIGTVMTFIVWGANLLEETSIMLCLNVCTFVVTRVCGLLMMVFVPSAGLDKESSKTARRSMKKMKKTKMIS